MSDGDSAPPAPAPDPPPRATGGDLSILIRCMGHKSLVLRPGGEIKVGRQSDNDLVLADGTVSRHHATIRWDRDEDRPYVLDHKSANGVDVDGEPVDHKAYLTGDNQIDVGDFTLVLELREGGTRRWKTNTARRARPSIDPSVLVPADDDDDAAALLEGSVVVRLFGERGEDLRGEAATAADVQRVLLNLEDDERTGTFRIQLGTRKGKITFSKGEVVTAKAGDVRGFDAVRTILQATGRYEFTRDVQPSDEFLKIKVSTVLAALRKDD